VKFNVKLEHKTHGVVDTVVDLPEVGENDSPHESWEEIVTAAQKNAASRYVDFESFGNDSKYLDRLEEVGAEFEMVDALVESDQPNKRWAVYGHYSNNDGGTWNDHVEAPTYEIAAFYARKTMAYNEYEGRTGVDQTDFQITMDEIQIFDCYEEPVTKDEAIGELKAAYAAMQNFVDKCDRGEAKSVRTYAAFKALLGGSRLPAEMRS
jgi:hypothetical protein